MRELTDIETPTEVPDGYTPDEWRAIERDYFEGSRRERPWEFARAEVRRSSRRRSLTCGHEADATEPYRYFVGKAREVEQLVQATDCDFCMRRDSRY